MASAALVPIGRSTTPGSDHSFTPLHPSSARQGASPRAHGRGRQDRRAQSRRQRRSSRRPSGSNGRPRRTHRVKRSPATSSSGRCSAAPTPSRSASWPRPCGRARTRHHQASKSSIPSLPLRSVGGGRPRPLLHRSPCLRLLLPPPRPPPLPHRRHRPAQPPSPRQRHHPTRRPRRPERRALAPTRRRLRLRVQAKGRVIAAEMGLQEVQDFAMVRDLVFVPHDPMPFVLENQQLRMLRRARDLF